MKDILTIDFLKLYFIFFINYYKIIIKIIFFIYFIFLTISIKITYNEDEAMNVV